MVLSQISINIKKNHLFSFFLVCEPHPCTHTKLYGLIAKKMRYQREWIVMHELAAKGFLGRIIYKIFVPYFRIAKSWYNFLTHCTLTESKKKKEKKSIKTCRNLQEYEKCDEVLNLKAEPTLIGMSLLAMQNPQRMMPEIKMNLSVLSNCGTRCSRCTELVLSHRTRNQWLGRP